MRRFGNAPLPGQKYKRRHGVYAVLPIDGGILATFQGGSHDEFQLPGGGIDPGEQPILALHREVMEETGWHIANPKLLLRFKRFTFMPEYNMWAEKLCSIYQATPTMRISKPLEDDHTAVWLNYAEAIDLLSTEGDVAALTAFVGLKR